MIASHNSWTFATPKKWWMKLIKFTAKCQNKNIQEQYALGVRLFDLRLKGRNVCHGLIEYDIDFMTDLLWLNGKGDAYVRVLCERDGYEDYFKNIMNILIGTCKNIQFLGGQRKSDWKKLVELPDVGVIDRYSSTTSLFPYFKSKFFAVLDDLWPWLYSYVTRKQRASWKKEFDGTWLMMDFVEL